MRLTGVETQSNVRTPGTPKSPFGQKTVRLRPPLKWAGGKRWQLQHLREIWEPHARRRLVEPFCGGLAVTLGLAPSCALLNDVNPHVINLYRWLQRGLKLTLPMNNDAETTRGPRVEAARVLHKWRLESLSLLGGSRRDNHTGRIHRKSDFGATVNER